ncbi:MAG: hypothetical protein LAQ30_13355 [Acidobacteriia bacterium]|nr:hypothetical protein [Terriglobia bacterium]
MTDYLDWGVDSTLGNPNGGMSGFGMAFTGPGDGDPWLARTNGGVGVSIAAMDGSAGLMRVDNDKYYFDGVQWVRTSNAIDLHTYAGHFDSIPNLTSAQPYGDHLIGFGYSQPGLVLNLDRPAAGVGFRIATAGTSANTDFVATLSAYDINNVLLGNSVINVKGLGGLCPGLNSTGANAPTPCNDAPYIAYYGLAANVSRITVTVSSANGTDGMYIDSLLLNDGTVVPEPGVWALLAGGLGLMWLRWAKTARLATRRPAHARGLRRPLSH